MAQEQGGQEQGCKVRVVNQSRRIVYRAYGDGRGGVLLDLDTSLYFGVNGVGALIWDLIGSGSSEADIVAGVREQIPEAPPEVESDVAAFLDELASRGLIDVTEN